MIRRLPWLRLVQGALCCALLGCESHRSWLRPKDDDDTKVRSHASKSAGSDGSGIIGADSDETQAEPFFKNNRRFGGLSSEARDIERNLGLN
jgi:hypothetical protein